MHLTEMEAVKAGMPVVCVNHSSEQGAGAKDIHMENFTVSVGGRDLIQDGCVTLSFGRHYGESYTTTILHMVTLSNIPNILSMWLLVRT